MNECKTKQGGKFGKLEPDYLSEEGYGWADDGEEQEPHSAAITHRVGNLGYVFDGCARLWKTFSVKKQVWANWQLLEKKMRVGIPST